MTVNPDTSVARKYPFSQKTAKRSALLRGELAQSASQNDLNRPWHYQITIHDREEARYKLGEAERRSPLR